MVRNDLIQIRLAVKELQVAKATCRMYTIGKGLITIQASQRSVIKKVARRKPKN
jgi:hypothetical protein